jgi:peptide/nickel transport system substrate-binding protein
VEKVKVEEKIIKEREIITTEPKYGGTLRVVAQGSFSSLDPLPLPAVISVHTSVHVYEHLFAWDFNLNPQPQLVDTWSISDDNMTYTFTLRDGITFHNGDPVTSDDVIASINRWLPAPPVKNTAGFISEAVKLDDLTFAINLNEPFGGLVIGLGTSPHLSPQIWPEDIANSAPFSEPITDWIGTGPYEFETWEPGNKLSIVRYDGFISRPEPENFLAGGKRAYLDRIEWVEIPNDETKYAGLETGQWDIVDGISLDFASRIRNNDDIGLVVTKPGNQSEVWAKGSFAPTDNKLVRQAILAAVDAESMMASLGDPALWILCSSVFFCGTPWESTVSAELYNQNNPERAAELLDQAGYNGETIVILNSSDHPQLNPLGIVLKPSLEAAGMSVEMPGMDLATVISRLGANDWNLFTNFCPASTCAQPDISPVNNLSETLWGWPGYPDLVAEFIRAPNLDAKKAVVDRMQAAAYEDAYNIVLGQFFPMLPHQIRVANLKPTAFPTYYNVWLD